MSTVQYDSNGNIINTQDEVLDQIADSQGNAINPAKEDGNLALIETKVLTDAQLRASPVPVNGTVNVGNFPAVQPVNDNGGSLTVDGTVELGATSLAALENITATVSGPIDLSSATLSALESTTVQNGAGVSAVNIQDGGNSITVDGTVNVGNFPATQNVNVTNASIAVTGPLTDTELRASAVPVSAASLPLPAGAATSALQTTGNSSLSSINTNIQEINTDIDVALSTRASSTNQTNGTQRTQITDGTNNADVINSNPAASTQALVVRAMPYRPSTFTVIGTQITLGNQKSMLAIQNTGTSVVRISKIYLVNTTTAAVTGVTANLTLQRIASFTGGTTLNPFAHNTLNVLPAGINIATGATFASESSLFRSSFWSSDEWGPGTSDVEANDHSNQEIIPWYQTNSIEEGITLIQNQGLHVKCNTNTTAGNFTITVIFTVEDV
jgi:hypothetical protein